MAHLKGASESSRMLNLAEDPQAVVTAWPVRNQKAETVIKHLVRDYFPDCGVPSVVHSDNGPAFIAHVFQVAIAAFDVRATSTPVYNPKSNTVEQFHRSMKHKLTALIHEFDD